MSTAQHILAAALAALAAGLYLERSLWLARHGSQDTVWSVVNRAAWFCVPLSVAGGFLQLAARHAPFEDRHYFIGAALLAVCVTHIGLRGKSPT